MTSLSLFRIVSVLLLGAGVAFACDGDLGNEDRAFGCGSFSGGSKNLSFANDCAAEQLCPTVGISADVGTNTDELVCFIDALVTDKAGRLSISDSAREGRIDTEIFLHGDAARTAYVISYGQDGWTKQSSGMAQYALASVEYFESCAAEEDLHVRFQCAERGLTESVVDVCWEAKKVTDYP